jgi:hypothetical protein
VAGEEQRSLGGGTLFDYWFDFGPHRFNGGLEATMKIGG